MTTPFPPLPSKHALKTYHKAGDDDETMLSPTTTSSSSWPDGTTTKFKGQYSTRVFQDRAIDVRIVPCSSGRRREGEGGK